MSFKNELEQYYFDNKENIDLDTMEKICKKIGQTCVWNAKLILPDILHNLNNLNNITEQTEKCIKLLIYHNIDNLNKIENNLPHEIVDKCIKQHKLKIKKPLKIHMTHEQREKINILTNIKKILQDTYLYDLQLTHH
jgi:hypothetical protein